MSHSQPCSAHRCPHSQRSLLFGQLTTPELLGGVSHPQVSHPRPILGVSWRLGFRCISTAAKIDRRRPMAGKQANSEVRPALKQDVPGKHKDGGIVMSKLIDYWGNVVITLEFVLLVFFSIKIMLRIGGWGGAALVAFMAPSCIMVVVLTRLLKNEFVKKYAMGISN